MKMKPFGSVDRGRVGVDRPTKARLRPAGASRGRPSRSPGRTCSGYPRPQSPAFSNLGAAPSAGAGSIPDTLYVHPRTIRFFSLYFGEDCRAPLFRDPFKRRKTLCASGAFYRPLLFQLSNFQIL